VVVCATCAPVAEAGGSYRICEAKFSSFPGLLVFAKNNY
jgi:hypothetical protein